MSLVIACRSTNIFPPTSARSRLGSLPCETVLILSTLRLQHKNRHLLTRDRTVFFLSCATGPCSRYSFRTAPAAALKQLATHPTAMTVSHSFLSFTPGYTATPLVFPASDAVINYSLGYVRLITFDFLPKHSIIRLTCTRRPRIAGCPW